MDNNPDRTSSSSSDEEENFTLAPEPPDNSENDDDGDTWYEAPAAEKIPDSSIEPESSQKKQELDKHTRQKHGSQIFQEDKASTSSTKASYRDLSVETDVDSFQQTYIPKMDDVREHTRGRVVNDEICITFHALLSRDTMFQPDTDHVFLHMWDRWSNISAEEEMQFVRYRQEARNAAEFVRTVVWKTKKQTYSGLRYRYEIRRISLDPATNVPLDTFMEEVYLDNDQNERKLQCTHFQNVVGNQYHQYDGFIYQPEGLWKKVKSAFTNKNADAQVVTRIFARDIANTLLRDLPTSEDILQATNMSLFLTKCVKETYKIESYLITRELWEMYTNVLRSLCYKDDLTVQRKMAVCILMLKVRYNHPFSAVVEASDQFCRSFLLKIDKQQKKVIEWEYLQTLSMEDRIFMKDQLLELAVNLASSNSNGKNPTWMYLLPIIHFLERVCVPFQKVSLDINHRAGQPKWWGLSTDLEHVKHQFKSGFGYAWNTPLRQIVTEMQYMFEVDFYLPRTMLACLTLEELKDALDTQMFPPEVCCACLTFFILTSLPSSRQKNIQLEKCIESLLLHIETSNLDGLDGHRLWIGTHITADMLDAALHRCKRTSVLYTLRIFLWFIVRFDTFCDATSESEELHTNTVSFENKFKSAAVQWLYKYGQKQKMGKVLEVWDNFLSPHGLQNTKRVNEWREMMKHLLENMIESELRTKDAWYEKQLVEAYCNGIDSYSPLFQDVLSSFILKALTEGVNRGVTAGHNQVYHMMWKNISKKFVEDYKQIAQLQQGFGLTEILSWVALPQFFKVLYQRCKDGELDKACEDNIKDIEALIIYCIKSLSEGTIFVKELNSLLQNKDTFKSLAVTLGYSESDVEQNLLSRNDNVVAFRKMKSTVATIRLFCSNMKNVRVDTSVLAVILDRDIEKSSLNELMEITHIMNKKTKDNEQEQIGGRGFSSQVIDMISRLEQLKDSLIFMKLWKDVSDGLSEKSTLSLDEMCSRVFQPAWQRLQNITKQISSREVLYKGMKTFLGQSLKKNNNKVVTELKIVCSNIDERILYERIEQFEQCRLAIFTKRLASTLVQIKNVFELTGDFSPVDDIEKIDVSNMTLLENKDAIIKAIPDVCKFTQKRLECLEAFVKCEQLIKWLRNVIADGMREVKVFVDLAMTSAGDDAEKMSRVQSLHAAVNGFSNLIFELGQESGCRDFLKACSLVWAELEATPKLPEKLEYACRYLHWFEDIKKAHGSVEVTSFIQAETINEYGIYKIGTRVWKRPDNQDHDFIYGESLDVGQVLKLTIVDENDESTEGPKEYTYDKLHDLQSRLMLVAGEKEANKDNVERFNSVLEGVVRLCNIYIQLVNSGCMLFRDFSIQIYCDTSRDHGRPVVAILEFQNEGSYLKCLKTEEEHLEDIMHKIANAMENCYVSWIKHVNQNREEFPELNFFTTDQLVILQREIAKFSENQKPSKLIFPMLCTVIPNCLPEDIHDANIIASESIESSCKKGTETGEETVRLKETKSSQEEFVKELVTNGYKHLVSAALKEFPSLDINEALLWCFDYAENQDNANDERENGGYQDAVAIDKLISKAIDNSSQFDRCETMLEKFEEIWNLFIDSISTHLKGFISLKHLGLLLRQMSEKDTRKFSRSLPKGYSETTPNLIVCPNEHIWNVTLSLFLSNEAQPLPEPDEVLTCCEQTTLEQVDIFLRRAFLYSNGKIHCLVNPDRMSFPLCEEIEKRLLKYQKSHVERGAKYRLVIICGSDSENKSVIISFLDKYRRTAFPMDVEKLRASLAKKFQAHEIESGEVQGAANVDFERSTVRVLRSVRSGVGKTLYKIRRVKELRALTKADKLLCVSLPLHERNVDINYVTRHLLPYEEEPDSISSKIVHIDITNEVLLGIDDLLFNLLILGRITDRSGFVWNKKPTDLYLMEAVVKTDTTSEKEENVLKLLPFVTCRSPKECLDIYNGKTPSDFSSSDQLFDSELFKQDLYQIPYACLREIDNATGETNLSKGHCLETILRHCGVSNPSWSEIYHFVKFLNIQLLDFQKTDFVSEAAVEALPGFRLFLQRFLIQMSRDFSSRSLNMSEETLDLRNSEDDEKEEHDLRAYKIKRSWEKSPHPYVFFNADRHTFTFLGFYINDYGDLVDIQSNTTLERGIMSRHLLRALLQNGVPIKEDFDFLHRNEKISRLCKVMGVPDYDEGVYDNTYELTTDNCKKMLAIYMRLRCDIPVIVMGETGCGKTRLVKFLCELMVPRDEKTFKPLTSNMIIMKVHGGVTNEEMKAKVKKAEEKAIENSEKYSKDMYTLLFFDEANTTESIGLIKEIMCDKTIEGKPLQTCKNLKFVAACNPYRRHPEEVIKKLENAGLGYHVKAKKTKDRFGRIPMRQLVYRVQPLPQSLLPFVWDFGQLDSSVEHLYIKHMVRRHMKNEKEDVPIQHLPHDEQLLEVVSSVLTESQKYMRNLKDECSFVSLRDVERVLQVTCWFYHESQTQRTIFRLADQKLTEKKREQTLDDVSRSLILALAVCYHASLTDREAYWKRVSKFFREPCRLSDGSQQIKEEIDRVQEVFLDSVKLDENSNIAKNQALKENVFMMVVCIELRIPLFLVGKPGSSKSLAKVIVADAMQGRQTDTKALFRELKQVQMVSFQCSPLSTSDGIVSIFHQCASFQENYKDKLDNFVSVVVLDEIGLAEDSDTMPLKALHPLLEDGCQGDEIPEDYKKVAFIGISNWSLDPAKMNRGIFVQREVPDSLELENTARGICSSTEEITHLIIRPLAAAYLKVFQKASMEIREFFGLRDFYSLMKMINGIIKHSESPNKLTYRKLRYAVRRNFSGLENIDTFKVFLDEMKSVEVTEGRLEGDPDDSFSGLIKSWISDTTSGNRHLLLLTEHFSALQLFQQAFLIKSPVRPVIIFGSSFRQDQEYTQICRNINKIKICMETGSLVILVNSDNLYESLYDALNQYYVYFGGERYVDLGLGTHRVKCPVHKDFKLIVVAEKQTVYEKFPIPLINRLEKHCFDSSNLLSKHQNDLSLTLKNWVKDVTKNSLSLSGDQIEKDAAKVFVGYHSDACSTIALEVWTEEMEYENNDHWTKAVNRAKDILIWCAAPDAIARMTNDNGNIQDIYWNKQAHESLKDYLTYQFKGPGNRNKLYAQITTHSSLLTISHKKSLSEATDIHTDRILLLEALPSFDTEQQFISKIKDHIRRSNNKPTLLVIQCDSGDKHSSLIACAKYAILDECTKFITASCVSILFIVQLAPMENTSFHSIQCGEWHSAHIDNLYTPVIEMPTVQDMQNNRMSTLIATAISDFEVSQYNIDEQERALPPGKRLDFRKLIDRSLQRAVSHVKDPEEHKYRSTKRVSLILSVLHEPPNKDRDGFVRGVGVLVEKIMEDRENKLSSSSAYDWLATEASSTGVIEKLGTFRRACLQAFDSRISPILGGIFTVLDTNHNLNILENESGSWQRDLWTNLLNTKSISHILMNDINRESGIQYEAEGTGFGGRIFQCKMPFSWIIYFRLDNILKRENLLQRDSNDKENNVISILLGTEIAVAIETIPKKHFYEVLECYIYDFVQMAYTEEKDMKLVLFSIKEATMRQISLDEETSILNTFIVVHQVYQDAKPGLNYFRDISNVWPECTNVLLKKQDVFENDLALNGLLLLIDSLYSVDQIVKTEGGKNIWLGKVHRYRQVVNQTLAFYKDTNKNEKTITEARCKWDHVVAMQLFLENMFVKPDDDIGVDRLPLLWALMTKGGLDFKCIKPLKDIERFLGIYFKKVKEEVMSDAKTCTKCGRVLTDDGKIFKCQHEICGKCVAEMQQDKSKYSCHKCKRPLEGEPIAVDKKKINSMVTDRVRGYRQRCNAVFMGIVSKLCFSDNTVPSSDVIEWLMFYSFKTEVEEDQELTSLSIVQNVGSGPNQDVGVNPNKVFKAFLFKHLVRANEHVFREHLKTFVQSKEMGTQTLRQKNDVFLTVTYSIEESLYDIVSVEKVIEWLKTASYTGKEGSVVDQIYFTAKTRLALSVCAGYINTMVNVPDTVMPEETSAIEKALESAKDFCNGRIYPWKYLLRYLVLEFGSDVLLTACKSDITSISWIKKEEMTTTVDMYTACGDAYVNVKDLLLKTFIDKSDKRLFTLLRTSEEKPHMAVFLELAVHREIVLQRALNREHADVEVAEIFDELKKSIENDLVTASLVTAEHLSKLHLDVAAGKDTDREINIKCLLFHWFCVIKHTNKYSCNLLQPLFSLALKPCSAKNAYLPAMPQDELADIRPQVLQTAADVYSLETTRYYQCENGHSYEIGQCGRPRVKAKCICGAEIGGESYRLHSRNSLDDGSDRTQTGHCIGLPENRQPGAVPERTMSSTQCAVIKMLLHMTMYLGCGKSKEDICSLIQSNIDSESIYQFLWDHIIIDLQDLRDNLSFGVDEVFIFSHCFIDRIMKTVKSKFPDEVAQSLEEDAEKEEEKSVDEDDQTIENYIKYLNETSGIASLDNTDDSSTVSIESLYSTDDNNTDDEETSLEDKYKDGHKLHDVSWGTKPGRTLWENEFASKYINTYIEEKTQVLQNGKQHLQESFPLLAKLSEPETAAETSLLQDNPEMWIYRKPVSINHFKQSFQRFMNDNPPENDGFAVLSLFLEKIEELQAVGFIPRILQLHKALLGKYSKRIFQSEAGKITVDQLRADQFAGEETEGLLKDLMEAWKITRHSLKTHVFRTYRDKRTAIPKQLSDMTITDDTQLVYLLPTMEGRGICTFALLDYLVYCQNRLIETYMSSGRGERNKFFTVVSPKNLTSAHVISFQSKVDLLPIILANCSMNSQSTLLDDYDFEAIEDWIIDRFISTKSRIRVEDHLQIDLMVYCSELTDTAEIEKLDKKIKQERLETTVKSALCADIVDVPGINHTLSALDIAINFLNITGGDPDEALNDYMVERLKMNKDSLTMRMQQTCLLKHVRSLWMTLLFHKSYIMVQHQKSLEVIFENLGSEYYELLPDNITKECHTYLERLSKERLLQLLEVLFEFMTLKLAKKQNFDDEDYLDQSQFRLKDCLEAFADIANMTLDVNDIPEIIVCRHSPHVWTCTAHVYHTRITEQN